MNFDDIKSAWDKAPEGKVTVPKTIDELKHAALPLDKIKRNMKKELLLQIAAIIFLAFVPQICNYKPSLNLPFYSVYILLVITSIYFFGRFYFFYKRISTISLNTKDALYEVNYDIRLNMELYKMFCYMLFPFLFIQVGLYLINERYDHFVNLIQSGIPEHSFYLFFIVFTAVAFTLLHFSAVYWLKAYYSKYANEIEDILKQLKEE
ncbi:hypothetical protein [Pedobacter nyackensis]|uniref:hypothetical protein n=1 Tax=Pedobacter nyackensis TaxID=475255 RepID=UPI00292CCD33|nr:hypothetical protein [Pedobacter nyackensis]